MIEKLYNLNLIRHPRLGDVRLSLNRRSRRVMAKWQQGMVRMTIPRLFTATELLEMLDRMESGLMRSRPASVFKPGTVFSFPGVEFRICRDAAMDPERIIAYPNLPVTKVCVGSRVDCGSTDAAHAISKVIHNSAHALAQRLLLPRAREIAANVGASPAGWKIGRGQRTLGHCDSRGIITISHVCTFLTQELRDYVVCHELAHLLEMNHSARFHQVCDRYCGGRAQELEAKLRAFSWQFR